MTDYIIRKLTVLDYTNFLYLINQFRPTSFSFEDFQNTFCQIQNLSTIWVIEFNNVLIGTATILYEFKFIHNIVKLAHIEDVCIDSKYRNKGIGNVLIQYIIQEAKRENCYKIILNCDESLEYFYRKSGLDKNGIQMVKYF
jgi:glucosamine-phosphate N-acetyltransferase